MSTQTSLTIELSPEEQEMVNLLQEDMGLANREEVMQLLVRQAAQRVAITCPTCGHYAKRTEEHTAECRSCLSVITLTEDIWEVTGSQQ